MEVKNEIRWKEVENQKISKIVSKWIEKNGLKKVSIRKNFDQSSIHIFLSDVTLSLIVYPFRMKEMYVYI